MGAIAGRVLILPKGEYDATVAYEFLDLINYGGRSWIAKKSSVGIEPTDANAEYWQPFGSSIIPDGVTVEINENGEISVADSPKLGGKDASEYALDADLANYLPLSAKPTGTYSGNGDDTQRRIATGGTGHVAIVFSASGLSILATYCVTISSSGAVTWSDNAWFEASSGSIVIKSSDATLNSATGTYRYQVV